jgi:TRAP transporter TAXI family solute receptor
MTIFSDFFGINRIASIILSLFCVLMLIAALFFFVHSAPPDTLTISSGPEGSMFYSNAVKYASSLATHGIKLNILTSEGSFENLQRLGDASQKVDIGFVQAGISNDSPVSLESLGSIQYQPLLVFYRGDAINTLGDLSGRRIAIGAAGSGTRNLALTLLAANGIKPGDATTLLEWEPTASADALMAGNVDAVFLMGEDASVVIMRELLHATNIHLMNFKEAEAYTRRFSYLNVLKLPEGAIDLGKDIPRQDVFLIGPAVEIIARKGLHPALSDLVLEAAQNVHGKAGFFQHKGEFPSVTGDRYPISAHAVRFYKSRKKLIYRYLPFWLASLISRIVVYFIPAIVIMIPIVRSVPHMYRWQNQLRIYRWYRALLSLEKEVLRETDPQKRKQLMERLDQIETEANKMKVPASLADQFYGMRYYIGFVRDSLNPKPPR